MLNAAKMGDRTIGVCFCHRNPITVGGTIITGSQDTLINGLPAARLGDTIQADCGHQATIITASFVDLVNGLGQARIGDLGVGCYNCTIITGSPDTFTT